jgi:hypothetical protein
MESAISQMTVMPVTPSERKTFIEKVVDEITSGERNPLDFNIILKEMEDTIEAIRKDERVKNAIMIEANKYSEKSFEYKGYKITKSSRSTYDYSTCNDDQWNKLSKEAASIKEKLKARESFLAAIKPDFDSIVNGETGEMLCAPAKTTTDYLTIKR